MDEIVFLTFHSVRKNIQETKPGAYSYWIAKSNMHNGIYFRSQLLQLSLSEAMPVCKVTISQVPPSYMLIQQKLPTNHLFLCKSHVQTFDFILYVVRDYLQ